MRFARLKHLLIALPAAAGLLLWLAHPPIPAPWPAWAPALLCCLLGGVLFRYRFAWLMLLPALWPVIDLVPITGRMYFAESDALVLLVLLCCSLRALRDTEEKHKWRPHATLLLGGIALSYAISTATVLVPLPPLDLNSFAGYMSPWNGLRLCKGIAWALLLLPLWARTARPNPEAARRALMLGMTAGLATASLAALWERLAFNKLLDFATDYRVTAMFWEMHIGGAALDGWLMLTLPFAVAGLLQARSRLAVAAYGGALMLGAYAALTTFSRGVYLGCALMLLCVLPFMLRRDAAQTQTTSWPTQLLRLALIAAACLVSVPLFHHGGYRALLALAGAALLAFHAGGLLRPLRPVHCLLAGCMALPAVLAAYALHDLVDKGIYLWFAFTWFAAAACLVWCSRQPADASRLVALIAVLCCAGSIGAVALHWGGDAAESSGIAASALIIIALLLQTTRTQTIWSTDRRATGIAAASAIGVLSLAVGMGSYFIGSRFSTVNEDLAGRVRHWQHGIALIQTPFEWSFGIGTGRYAERYYWNAPIDAMPGSWRILEDGDQRYLALGGPRHTLGFNELLRITQQIGLDATGPFSLHMRVRAPELVTLHLEVCRKHLLYPGACGSITYVEIQASKEWSDLNLVIPAKELADARGTIPAITDFSVAMRTTGKRVDIDDISLRDATGRERLANGSFDQGADRWFFSSDRIHLPWHAKSILVHLLVENGIFGLLAVGFASCFAFARLLRRSRLEPAMALPLLAALAGFFAVGVFDSLLDVPRDACFFFLLLGVALRKFRTPQTHTPQPA